MAKEARDFDAAFEHYLEAERLAPHDADLQLQLGHFYKTVDRLDCARVHYGRAIALASDWPEPQRELAALASEDSPIESSDDRPEDTLPVDELLPGPVYVPPADRIDAIRFARLGGRQRRIAGGYVPLLSGVEAVRGHCFSDRPLVEATLSIDGQVRACERIGSIRTDRATWKAVFNIWVDLSDVPSGMHRIELILADASGWTRRRTERVAIAAPSSRDASPFDSDGWTKGDPEDARPIVERIRTAPSMVRPVERRLLVPPAAILVLRTDQLGDMVVSIPALRRLRALFPAARIVGLVTQANAEFAATLGLFDDILVADFPDDPDRRRRTMTPSEQRSLAAMLSTFVFDVALDLATSDISRQLLRLAGARMTFGFDDDGSPWLDGGISGHVRDPRNAGEATPQSGRILALVERLGTLYATGADVIRRPDLTREDCALPGLGIDDRFVVFHAGARVAFSRWRGFPDLVRTWLDRHGDKIVLLTQGTEVAAGLSEDLLRDERLIVIDHRLPFDMLDALLSFAALFVGNDSGPKHLAALRGVPVVSIHCARIGWAEWAQEQTGVVVSRRVPCAGCAIFHDPEACGKDFACIADITVDEVLAAGESLSAR